MAAAQQHHGRIRCGIGVGVERSAQCAGTSIHTAWTVSAPSIGLSSHHQRVWGQGEFGHSCSPTLAGAGQRVQMRAWCACVALRAACGGKMCFCARSFVAHRLAHTRRRRHILSDLATCLQTSVTHVPWQVCYVSAETMPVLLPEGGSSPAGQATSTTASARRGGSTTAGGGNANSAAGGYSGDGERVSTGGSGGFALVDDAPPGKGVSKMGYASTQIGENAPPPSSPPPSACAAVPCSLVPR